MKTGFNIGGCQRDRTLTCWNLDWLICHLSLVLSGLVHVHTSPVLSQPQPHDHCSAEEAEDCRVMSHHRRQFSIFIFNFTSFEIITQLTLIVQFVFFIFIHPLHDHTLLNLFWEMSVVLWGKTWVASSNPWWTGWCVSSHARPPFACTQTHTDRHVLQHSPHVTWKVSCSNVWPCRTTLVTNCSIASALH